MFISFFLLINNSTLLHCAEKRCFSIDFRQEAGDFSTSIYMYIIISIMFKPLIRMQYTYMSSGGEGKNWKG